jgi:hypothetical protein
MLVDLSSLVLSWEQLLLLNYWILHS